LWIATTLASLALSGTTPEIRDLLNTILKGMLILLEIFFRILPLIPSSPELFLDFSLPIILSISKGSVGAIKREDSVGVLR